MLYRNITVLLLISSKKHKECECLRKPGSAKLINYTVFLIPHHLLFFLCYYTEKDLLAMFAAIRFHFKLH